MQSTNRSAIGMHEKQRSFDFNIEEIQSLLYMGSLTTDVLKNGGRIQT